jgi:outer membrane protein TolC
MVNNVSLKLLTGALVVLLAGCATSNDPQQLHQQTNQAFTEHHPDYSLDKSIAPGIIDHLQHKPLSLQQAVQLMLVNSPQVVVELHKLGVADAKRIQAGLIRNPHFFVGALYPESGDGWKLDFGISQSLADLFTLSLRKEIAQGRLLNAQLNLQHTLQELIRNTSDRYSEAVAAQQSYQVQQQLYDAILARQQLAASIYDAGNMSEANYLYYEQERQSALRKLQKRKLQSQQQQSELAYQLGLNSTQQFILPFKLPEPSTSEQLSRPALLADAYQHRQDLRWIKQQQANLDQQSTLVSRESAFGDLTLGVNGEREFDGARAYGPEIEMELPLFNRGAAKKQILKSQQAMLDAQLIDLSLKINKDIKQALNQLNLARDHIQDTKASIQTAERRVQLSQREVNYMLASPFDLLKLAQQKSQVQQEYINNLKHYWQARAQLELTIGMSIPNSQGGTQVDTTPEENNEHQNHNQHKGHQHD